MNTPNKLTLARMIATPIFMAIMLIDFPYHYVISLVLFYPRRIACRKHKSRKNLCFIKIRQFPPRRGRVLLVCRVYIAKYFYHSY